MEHQDNRRKRNQTFAYFLVIIAAILFLAILAGIMSGKIPQDQIGVTENWGTILLTGVIVAAAAFEWGSSKGTQTKDEAAAAGPPAPPPGTSTVHIETATTKGATP